MTATTYTLPVNAGVRTHGAWSLAWLGDYDSDTDDQVSARDFTVIDAMAASGDFFVMLATRLDKLAQGLPTDSSEQIELEHLVKTLFYLQDNYDLSAKYKKRR